MEDLTGAELVKAVSLSMPTSDLSEILEKTNDILNIRLFKKLPKNSETIFDLVKYLADVSEENALQILEMVILDSGFPEDLRNDARKFIDSGLFNSTLKFIIRPKKSFMARLCSSKTL